MRLSQCLWASLSLGAALGCDDNESSSSAAASASIVAASASIAPPPTPKPWYFGSWTAELEVQQLKVDLTEKEGLIKAWKEDQGTERVGGATLALSISEEGQVKGKLDGVLGSATIEGIVDEDTLRTRVLGSSDAPSAAVFNGTLVAKRAGELLEGELKVSSGDSRTLRRAAVSLAKAVPKK